MNTIKTDYNAKGAAMLLVREITQYDPNLIGSKEWTKIFNKAVAIKTLADKARNQSGSILPELLMLFAVLFVLVFAGQLYVGKYDATASQWLNINMEGRK